MNLEFVAGGLDRGEMALGVLDRGTHAGYLLGRVLAAWHVDCPRDEAHRSVMRLFDAPRLSRNGGGGLDESFETWFADDGIDANRKRGGLIAEPRTQAMGHSQIAGK